MKRIPTGSVFQQAYTDRHGVKQKSNTWYIQYYLKGKRKVTSTGTADYEEALAMLRKRMAGNGQTAPDANQPERVRMGQLFDLVIDDYKRLEKRTFQDVVYKIESRLRPFFGKVKAADMTSTLIRKYQDSRLREKPRAANGSVNRELAYVRLALNLGAEQDPPLVMHVPKFPMLPEAEPREGFVTPEQYRALRDNLPDYARTALVVAYHVGCRKQELTLVEIRNVDLDAKRILMPGRTTKNKRPKYVPIYGDMEGELRAAINRAKPGCKFLLQENGVRVADFRKSWDTACAATGLEGTLFHDLRRTAATNMIESGMTEKEAMELTGHKTAAMFRRYHIVRSDSLDRSVELLEKHMAKSKRVPVLEMKAGA